jgi:hypothetical protein
MGDVTQLKTDGPDEFGLWKLVRLCGWVLIRYGSDDYRIERPGSAFPTVGGSEKHLTIEEALDLCRNEAESRGREMPEVNDSQRRDLTAAYAQWRAAQDDDDFVGDFVAGNLKPL